MRGAVVIEIVLYILEAYDEKSYFFALQLGGRGVGICSNKHGKACD
jgi:hypothetical protein